MSPVSISRMTPGETREIKVWIDGTRTLTPASDGVTFSSNNTSVATVSNAGIITGVAEGNTSIIVTRGTKTVTVTITVQ